MSAEVATIADAGRVVIGIGGLAVRRSTGGVIMTHALGSCVGIAVHDPRMGIGGMLHAQLPLGQQNPERARSTPSLFVDLGLDLLFRGVAELGGDKRRLRITVAGAANMISGGSDFFQIANRNLTVMRKVLWQAGLLIAGESVGGTQPRTMSLLLDTGQTVIDSMGQRQAL